MLFGARWFAEPSHGECKAAEPAPLGGTGRVSRMLILVRKVQQGIWIEGDIWVKVLAVDRDRVKLGITAPGEVKVMRQELIAEVENPGTPESAEPATPSTQ